MRNSFTLKRRNVPDNGRIASSEKLIAAEIIDKRILEIGAGDYSFSYMAGYRSWFKIDFAAPCDAICDVNTEHLHLPFSSQSFDFIICTQVLEHLLWPQQLLKECHRVLTANGKILVSVPNTVSLTYRLAWLMGRIPSCAAAGNLPDQLGQTAYKKGDGGFIGGHVIDFNIKRIRRLLAMCGFDPLKLKGSGIIWKRQILPPCLLPAALSSDIICIAQSIP